MAAPMNISVTEALAMLREEGNRVVALEGELVVAQSRMTWLHSQVRSATRLEMAARFGGDPED